MRVSAALLPFAAGFFVVVTGPLAGTMDAQDAGALDPCAVLTEADVEAVVGEKSERSPRARRTDYGTMHSMVCTHRTPGWTVALHIERGRTAEEVEGYLKTLGAVVKKTTGAPGMTPVAGLGDRAWWGPVNPTNGILHVVKGTDVIWVQTHGTAQDAGTLDKTKVLMERALARY